MARTKAKATASKEKEPKERKLDMFREVLPAIDRRDFGFWDNLSQEQRKELSIWLVQRWASSAESQPGWQEYFIQAVNERVNTHQGDLKEHPELQWMLLASCGAKRTFRRSWLGASKRAKKDTVSEFISDMYPTLGEQEIELMRAINDETELKTVAEQMNIKRSAIKDIFG